MARRSLSRSTSASGAGADTVIVGRIRGAHGMRGELDVEAETDNPDRFASGRSLIVDGLGEREIVSVRGTGRVILRLAGIDDRPAAEALRDRDLRVPLADARAAARGHLWADLVGLHVVDEAGTALGTLVEVLRAGGAADVFVVRDDAGGERLLPVIESVVREIDVTAGRIVARLQEEA